jgi:hypothetical protein
MVALIRFNTDRDLQAHNRLSDFVNPFGNVLYSVEIAFPEHGDSEARSLSTQRHIREDNLGCSVSFRAKDNRFRHIELKPICKFLDPLP